MANAVSLFHNLYSLNWSLCRSAVFICAVYPLRAVLEFIILPFITENRFPGAEEGQLARPSSESLISGSNQSDSVPEGEANLNTKNNNSIKDKAGQTACLHQENDPLCWCLPGLSEQEITSSPSPCISIACLRNLRRLAVHFDSYHKQGTLTVWKMSFCCRRWWQTWGLYEGSWGLSLKPKLSKSLGFTHIEPDH